MKKNSKFLIAILISLQLLGATELTVKELVKKMQSQRETIHSYTADILNTVEGSLIQGKKVERGRIIFQEPDTIRSETIDPFQLTLTVSGVPDFAVFAAISGRALTTQSISAKRRLCASP
jgi:outer membrane lipoprotein-sorting protein